MSWALCNVVLPTMRRTGPDLQTTHRREQRDGADHKPSGLQLLCLRRVGRAHLPRDP